MNYSKTAVRLPPRHTAIWMIIAVILITAVLTVPHHTVGALTFALLGIVDVAKFVIPGILLTAWIIASGADAQIAGAFEGRTLQSVIVASAIGAITPVCGVTILPLMAGLLAAGIPLAPVMAFWLASPITDPAMIATTVAMLGWTFAVGKTIAAFAMGLGGGLATALFSQSSWSSYALRDNRIVRHFHADGCRQISDYQPRFWHEAVRRKSFYAQLIATTRLMLICLIPAFMAEYALNATLSPDAFAPYVGSDKWWAIPAAVFIGAPAYIDGYAALPLTRGLIDNGMSLGAAMAFLISGGVVSIWGALAIFPVLKLKPFLLYLLLAITGSLVCGYVFDWVV